MRNRLPPRRASEVIEFTHIETNGNKSPYVATIGQYPDGRIGEVFLDAPKKDSAVGILCHDAAVLISIALQHGVEIGEMQEAVARTKIEDGLPQSVIGTTLDVLKSAEGQAE